VLRTLGAEVSGTGTTEAGIAVVRSYLDGLGVQPEEAILINGSGLSRSAMLAPVVLTAVLTDMARDRRVSPEFAASLSIGGTDGTLWSRLRDEPGRLRGKTGTIENVHCLAGYLDADDGRRYAFAFMVNDHGGRAQAVRDAHDSFARSMFGVHAPDRAPSP
jgi:serine-type D-Ala-D-Ala carboxypeptidase/endopeptidase (penicillin-binding protein 4)